MSLTAPKTDYKADYLRNLIEKGVFSIFGGVRQNTVDSLIEKQQEEARKQKEMFELNKRSTLARDRAVRKRGTAFSNQRKSRSMASPRGGTILTGGGASTPSLIGGGGMGRTSIIGG